MFTREEKDFIDSSPEFVGLLKSMNDKELSAFAEIVTYICDLSQEEKTAFLARIDSELKKMGRPGRLDFAQMVSKEFENGLEDLALIDDWAWLDKCYDRFMKGDVKVLDEVRAAVAEKKMEKAVKTPPLRNAASVEK